MGLLFPKIPGGRLQDYDVEIHEWYKDCLSYLTEEQKDIYCDSMIIYLKTTDVSREELADLISDKTAAFLFHLVAYHIDGEIERQQPKRIRNSGDYSEWRKAVFNRDNYTCQKCGKKGGKLNAHHIKPFARYPSLRLVIENGITLCTDCHKGEHKRGYKYAE